MKFHIDTYWQDVGALLGEFVDEETIRDFGGDPQFAYEAAAALRFGLTNDEWVVTPEPPDEIDRLIVIAREGKARGELLITMIRAGGFR